MAGSWRHADHLCSGGSAAVAKRRVCIWVGRGLRQRFLYLQNLPGSQLGLSCLLGVRSTGHSVRCAWLRGIFGRSPAWAVLGLVGHFAQVAALVLLFTKSSAAWFKPQGA